MNTPTFQMPAAKPADEDLREQARPGHGVPSQDPDPAAQYALTPDEAQREAQSVFTGAGVVAGAATGVAIGVAVAGPVGGFVGGTVGGVAGVLGGAAAGAGMKAKPTDGADAKPPADETV